MVSVILIVCYILVFARMLCTIHFVLHTLHYVLRGSVRGWVGLTRTEVEEDHTQDQPAMSGGEQEPANPPERSLSEEIER